MNRRLTCILSKVEPGIGLIDVGTDHGYLPVELARRGYPGALFASDIGSGPLKAAKRSAVEAGVSDRIHFLLCDGLDACPPGAVDTIVIAGMGGDTICGILDRAEWCMDRRYKLLLQPMTRAEVLRYWLANNEFEITGEELTEDAGELYQVLSARFGGTTRLSEAELFTGSFALICQDPLCGLLLERQCARFERAAAGLRKAEGVGNAGKLALLETILTQLREMKRTWQP